jgi:hypothetical protein
MDVTGAVRADFIGQGSLDATGQSWIGGYFRNASTGLTLCSASIRQDAFSSTCRV